MSEKYVFSTDGNAAISTPVVTDGNGQFIHPKYGMMEHIAGAFWRPIMTNELIHLGENREKRRARK